jgi:spore coat protein U-like protein
MRLRAKAAVVSATAIALTFPLISHPAGAETKTTPFTVSANVMAVCTLAATNLAFGTYDASAASPTDATNTITVKCTNGQAYTIALNAGTGSGASVSNRFMTNGSRQLSYALYTTSARSSLWGDGSMSTSTVAGTGNGASQSFTAYGRIPVAQFQTNGSYSDTITVTLTY